MPEPLRIRDLSGGIADGHPAHIPDNCVAAAYNVEFWDGTAGGRRNGSTAVKTAFIDPTNGMFTHTPTALRSGDRLWIMTATGALVYMDSAYAETNPTITDGDLVSLSSVGVDWVSLHGKLFIAAKRTTSAAVALDRLAVFDGTAVRRVGIAAPAAAPTAADNGVGSYADTRYFRVRFTVQASGATIRRSEPSAERTFAPSGTGSGVTVTRPATLEGATHWELEQRGSNGVDWYRIATTAIATTTHTTTLALVSVASDASSILSADIGDYSLIPSAKYLAVDEDRLIYAGSHEDTAKGSRVGWTPVYGDTSGVGNDERTPTDVAGYLDFDALDGGDITGIRGWNGKVIVFKRGQTHSMVRTGGRARAYLPDTLSKLHGAVPHSIMEGTDRHGQSCLLFVDEEAGPMMLSSSGLRILLDERMRKLWKDTYNRDATYPLSCVWHAGKGQGWWHIAAGASTDPSVRWVYESTTEGIVFHTLPLVARSAAYFNGYPHFSADTGVATSTNKLIKGDDPTATSDYGTNFRAYIRTKAYQLGGLAKRFAFVAAVLEAKPSPGLTLNVKFIRDYGLETSAGVDISIAATGSETYVSVPVDNAFMSESQALQIEFGDATARSVAAWQVYGWMVPWTLGSSTTGVS